MVTVEQMTEIIKTELSRFGKDQVKIQLLGNDAKITIFTDSNQYMISLRERHEGPNERTTDYMGCISNCRKPRAGEDWARGNDLADGSLSLETWNAIKADIISYELVKIHNPADALRKAEIPNTASVNLPETVPSV